MATTILSRYINDNEELTGWRFEPSDEALVSYFLYNKIIGKELSEFQKMCVRDYDLYGDEEPYDIWDKFEGQENQDLFFITALKNLKKRNNEKGLRYDRKVGGNGGKWHGENAKEFEVSVSNCGTRKIEKAIRKRFCYRNSKSDQDGLWIMLEYSLEMNDEYVICRLRKNVRGANGVRDKKKRGVSAVAAVTDISEYPANKRMRETLMQDGGLQRVESEESICENQNQKHEYLIGDDPNLEVPQCCPSVLNIESQFNGEDTILHSIEVSGGMVESTAYCRQQHMAENQNVVEAIVEGESMDEMNGGESESAAYSGQQQEATLVQNQNVGEGECAVGDADILTTVDDWKCCIDELIRDLDYNDDELAGSFGSNNNGFEGENGFSSTLLKMSSFKQQESDQFWTTSHYF